MIKTPTSGAERSGGTGTEPAGERFRCGDCGLPFKTAQGLAGHRRLAHSTRTARELDERKRSAEQREAELKAREAVAERRAMEVARSVEVARHKEAEVLRRAREIEETGPKSIGLNRCPACKAWFEDSDGLQAHSRAVHPLEPRIAEELGVPEEKVSYIWKLAKRYTANHPDEGHEEIEKRFWWEKERQIYRRLRELDASFEEE